MIGAVSGKTVRPEPWNGRPYAQAMDSREGDLSLRDGEGWLLPLEVMRWTGLPDVGDETVLARCEGGVLDIGCGAGRLVEALARRGSEVLGIDVCTSAVISTVCRGGPARSGSVFDPLPAEGGWGTALLIDGNIGIGGDPGLLLRRIGDLVRDGGLLIVEVSATEVDERRRVRLYAGQRAVSPVFSWAAVGPSALERLARESGWSATERWTGPRDERHFVALRARA
ncbi:methyltransferase domain-containing protein [Streptomyces sp. AB3(2024)]|uniref:methyltransferase domain-containing protein n=1 Tax=Streptomyces sp. AB3(2024) TaxID=3317321 RepID=UPI0035A35473